MFNSASSIDLRESRIYNTLKVDSARQSLLESSSRSQQQHHLTIDQQQLILSWSHAREQPGLIQVPIQLQQSTYSQAQQQQLLLEQYQRQILNEPAGMKYQQPELTPEQLQQQQEQQLLIEQQQQQLIEQQQQEYNQPIPTQFDQAGMLAKWQEQTLQYLQNIKEMTSLNESILPTLYKYFEAAPISPDPHYGDISILTHKLNPSFKLALCVNVYKKYQVAVQAEKAVQLRKAQFTHPNIINVHLIHTRKFLCLFSATYRVCTVQDYINHNIANRTYNEHQIIQLLENVTEALYSLHLKGLVHGNIQQETIYESTLIDNQNVFKIRYEYPNNNSNLQEKFQSPHKKVLLSPEMYMAFKNQDKSYQTTWKCDIFCLALVVVQLNVNDSLFEIYDEAFLENKLQLWIKSLKYSHKLIQLLLQMTKPINQRPDLITLNETLSKWHTHQSLNYIYSLDVQERFENKLKQKSRVTVNVSMNHTPRSIEVPIHRINDIPKDQSYLFTKQAEFRNKRKIQYKDGSHYYGEVVNGVRDGIGIYTKGNTVYDCTWSNDIQQGQGLLYIDQQVIYEGEFRDGRYGGYGKLRNQQIKYTSSPIDYHHITNEYFMNYTGDFSNGEFNGFGTLEFSNGERLTCIFTDNLANGVGVFQTLDKRKINAQWESGHLIRRI